MSPGVLERREIAVRRWRISYLDERIREARARAFGQVAALWTRRRELGRRVCGFPSGADTVEA